ncbi:hypothetical protein NQ318_003320 [Aromia moschata]|uniref:G-protein coupled receptors family 1 profile domain-containing protein n=1 Tax=Aromia moschata TaxID=1265417 RepID=A0AAV8YNN1_9CUCU|nr:hypothetical protein NQ318_003320 [Aromia moschata]
MLEDFLCKMYMFIQSLSNTASIFILVVICTERYFAIIYPITCKQILTPIRLKMIIVGVWITCILYSSPKFYWGNTVTVQTGNNSETVCVLNRQKYNSELFDMMHFVLFYVIPLAVMSFYIHERNYFDSNAQSIIFESTTGMFPGNGAPVNRHKYYGIARDANIQFPVDPLLYTRIAICLWNSSEQLKKQLDASTNPAQYQGLCRKQSARYSKKLHANGEVKLVQSTSSGSMPIPNSSQNVLRARRGVIKMLIIVVCAFALCNLPFHARKMWQYWSSNYHGDTNFSALFTPLTFLSTYFNSGVNPLLYAFLSKNFRR